MVDSQEESTDNHQDNQEFASISDNIRAKKNFLGITGSLLIFIIFYLVYGIYSGQITSDDLKDFNFIINLLMGLAVLLTFIWNILENTEISTKIENKLPVINLSPYTVPILAVLLILSILMFFYGFSVMISGEVRYGIPRTGIIVASIFGFIIAYIPLQLYILLKLTGRYEDVN